MNNSTIGFAYFVDGKFVGWWGDTFGSITRSPKLYTSSEKQFETIQKNFTTKMEKINRTSFDAEKDNVTGLAAISLAVFAGEDTLRGKSVELRVVECPIYQGPNPDFDKDEYRRLTDERRKQMETDGVFNIPAPSIERSEAVAKYPEIPCNNWIYADYNKVNEWAANEPTEFVKVLKP